MRWHYTWLIPRHDKTPLWGGKETEETKRYTYCIYAVGFPPFLLTWLAVGRMMKNVGEKNLFSFLQAAPTHFDFPVIKSDRFLPLGRTQNRNLCQRSEKDWSGGKKKGRLIEERFFLLLFPRQSCNYVKRVIYLMCSGIINLRIRIEIERKVKIWSHCIIIFHVY